MFRISKALTAGAIVLLSISPSLAQTNGSVDFDALFSLGGGGTPISVAVDTKDVLRDTIRQRIIDLAVSAPPSPDATENANLNIGEIDQLNRNAEHAKAELELARTNSERRRLEIEELIVLYKALDEIDTPTATADSGTTQLLAAIDDLSNGNNTALINLLGIAPQGSGEPANQASQQQLQQAARDQDHSILPRVDAIIGAAGDYDVYIVNPDTTIRTMSVGDFTHTGLELVEATGKWVIFKSEATGQSYRLVPQSEPVAMPPEGNTGMSQAPNQAVDLQGLPFSMF